jgi:hypothetical protein
VKLDLYRAKLIIRLQAVEKKIALNVRGLGNIDEGDSIAFEVCVNV